MNSKIKELLIDTIKEDRVLNYILEGILGLCAISIILFSDKWELETNG